MATLSEELKSEWHPTKNPLTDLDKVKVTSKVWWRCKLGHEWEAVVDDRIRGTGCGYCANKKVWSGFNDLATTHPELAAQWHKTKNGNLVPSQVVAGSHKPAWWLCEKGHEWKTPISKRKAGHGCLYCTNQKVLAGFNDLATTHPELAKEWHPTKNGDLTPRDIIGTGKNKVWWVCSKGHEWAINVNNRKSRGHGCVYCSNQKVLVGFNDFGTTHPELAKEWHPTRNGDLTPQQVIKGSGKKIWWLGECGHEWAAILSDKGRFGCPYCPTNISEGEKSLYFRLSEAYPGLTIIQSDRSVLKNLELDIYMPEHNLAIEYNGLYWHSSAIRKNPKYHYDKWLACKENNITLLQIWSDEWLDEPDRIMRVIDSYINPKVNGFLTAQFICDEVLNLTITDGNMVNRLRHVGLFDKNKTLVSQARVLTNLRTKSCTIKVIKIISPYRNEIEEFVKFLNKECKEQNLVISLDNMLTPNYDVSSLHTKLVEEPSFVYYYNQRKYTKEELLHKKLTVSEIEQLPKLWDAGATLYRV